MLYKNTKSVEKNMRKDLQDSRKFRIFVAVSAQPSTAQIIAI
jgi:ribosomal protein L18